MSKIFEQKEEQLLENEIESSLENHPYGGLDVPTISPEEERELRDDKLREEADGRDRDLAEGWIPNE